MQKRKVNKINDRYLYRAKRTDTGEWVEGFYCKWIKGKRVICYSEKEVDCIITWMSNGGMSRYEVDPSTICQCTGLKDKNGKLIWENDIMVGHLDDKYPENATYVRVMWRNNGFCTHQRYFDDFELLDEFDQNNFEVCGNVFDNPELLEVEE